MKYPTYAEMKAKVENDLDLQDEEIIGDDEMLAYFNDAIREAESEILGIYEDYFLAKSFLALEQGTALYSLPESIFATKIRNIVYSVGTIIYPITRIRDRKKFLEIAYGNQQLSVSDNYRYIILNSTAADGVQLQLVPPSRETSDTAVTIWHIREANRLALDTDVCDIPEFVGFIYAFVKVECRKKEFNGYCPQEELGRLEQQRKLMVDSLTAMVPDQDTEVEKDMSFYEDQYDQSF